MAIMELEKLAAVLKAKGLTVAAAESLTAGRVSTALTCLPGSSVFFQGSVVAYSNQLKVELLGVPMDIILAHGAVSEECARAMAEGARRKMGVDLAVATTGIAGPDGGSLEKPVGLVWLAAADERRTVTLRNTFAGDREQISSEAAKAAWRLLASII